MESVTRGSKEDRHLALTKCPNTKCDKIPVERVGYIKNALTLAIRSHLKQFYDGEDGEF